MSDPSPPRNTPDIPLAEQIERSYAGIGVTGSHKYIMAMILLGVFFDAIEQNAVGITGPVVRDAYSYGSLWSAHCWGSPVCCWG